MDSGFQKISFNKSVKVVDAYKPFKKSLISFKVFTGFITGLIFLTVFLTIAVFFPARKLYFDVQKASISGQEVYNTLKNQDIESAKVKIDVLLEKIKSVNNDLTKISWIGYMPFVGIYEKDMKHLVNGSIAGVEALQISVDTLVPYADLLGLKGKSTFVAGTADERIKIAVETLDKVTPKLDEIAKKIDKAGQELDQIDQNRYPEKIGSFQLKNRIASSKGIFLSTAKLFVDAAPFFKQLPSLLGNNEPKTYLVIFQNDAELRATGGFITGYALFKIDKGKMQVIKSDDVYKLDAAKRKTFPAPSAIIKYHKNVNTLELRDSNLSPDFVESMKKFESMIKESVPDFPSFDGIIAVDTHVLVSAIKILGDFNVYGRNFSAETDFRCDCPKAIYELEDYSTRPVAYVRDERKDIIGMLLYQLMQRALGISPSKYWGRLFQMMLEEAQQKHILFYFQNQEAQKGLESLNFAGRVVAFEYDYLHINDVNFAGAKSNMFVRQSVKQEIELSDDGSIIKTLTINYKNPAPPSNCNLEAGQLCLNGILRDWIRIYTPSGSILLEFKGSEKETVAYQDLDKTVFEGFLTVKPQGTAEIVVKYKLPFKSKKGEAFQELIQKQPGTEGNDYSIFYKNSQKDKFQLLTDKNISFKL